MVMVKILPFLVFCATAALQTVRATAPALATPASLTLSLVARNIHQANFYASFDLTVSLFTKVTTFVDLFLGNVVITQDGSQVCSPTTTPVLYDGKYQCPCTQPSYTLAVVQPDLSVFIRGLLTFNLAASLTFDLIYVNENGAHTIKLDPPKKECGSWGACKWTYEKEFTC